jgi:hypothetical protein
MTGGPASTVARVLHAVDDLDWDTVRATLAAELAIDYTSLWGGQAQRLPVGELLTGWQELVPGFDATQHLIGPIVVTQPDDHTAGCDTNVRAYHRLAGATWLVAGRYLMNLTRTTGSWRITGITLRVAYKEGDRALVEAARQRVAAGTGRVADLGRPVLS